MGELPTPFAPLSADYPEFSFLTDNARELGTPTITIPPVGRVAMRLSDGRLTSAIRWGQGPLEMVLLHGGGQNAHTWDSFALAAGRPALAIDLPGHGHSDWREDGDYSPWANAQTIAEILAAAATGPLAVVANALGGLSAIALAADRPELVAKLVIVDVSPAVSARISQTKESQLESTALTRSARIYESLDAMVDATVRASPRRTPDSLRRGVRHNARQMEDGTWAWRYDTLDRLTGRRPLTELWDDLSRVTPPIMLVRGELSVFVGPDDVAEMRRRLPGLLVATVAGAGHNLHSERPRELVSLVKEFLEPTAL